MHGRSRDRHVRPWLFHNQSIYCMDLKYFVQSHWRLGGIFTHAIKWFSQSQTFGSDGSLWQWRGEREKARFQHFPQYQEDEAVGLTIQIIQIIISRPRRGEGRPIDWRVLLQTRSLEYRASLQSGRDVIYWRNNQTKKSRQLPERQQPSRLFHQGRKKE